MNSKFVRDFKEALKKQETTTYSSSYTNYSDICMAHFFEWSDLKSSPKEFRKPSEFLKFLKDCGITYTEEQEKTIKTVYTMYATCVPNESKLLIAFTKYGLEKQYEESQKKES